MAKVTEVHHDKKGLVCVVTLKTKSSTLQRPVDKLCIKYLTQPPVNHLYIDVNKLCDVVKYALTSLCENELQMIYTITLI